MMMTVRDAGRLQDQGLGTAVAQAHDALAKIHDPAGQGRAAFIRVDEHEALEAALRSDQAVGLTGRRAGPLAGITVSVKDLFNIAGQTTLAGSRVLAQAPTAARDAVVVERLRAAGAVMVGRTNMTEFAYSGLGINPHHGTPLNPWDRESGRIPGGSSSGAAVSVTDGMALAAVATDTGGSARIPAAFCGLTGFKPTAARIPLQGAFPLSPSLDSVGAIGATVDCCATLDAVLAGDTWQTPQDTDRVSLRLGLVTDYVTDGLDSVVAAAYERALSKLSRAGVQIKNVPFPELKDIPGYNHLGGFAAYESYRHHAGMLATHADQYDPRVSSRILRGQAMSEADYRWLQNQRASFMERAKQRFADFDALVMVTVPIVAPRLSECENDEAYARLNLLALRNPTVVNFLDGCAVSLPCHQAGDAPVGFSLFQTAHQDRALLSVACAVERLLGFHALSATAR